MNSLRQKTLNSIYGRSRLFLGIIYILLIVTLVFTSTHKLEVLFASTSIAIVILVVDFIEKYRAGFRDAVGTLFIILWITYWEFNPDYSESFWLFFLVLVYRIVLFIDDVQRKFFFILLILACILVSNIDTGVAPQVILTRISATTILAIVTYTGFSYLLSIQEELVVSAKKQKEFEAQLIKYQNDLDEAQRIGKLGGWEIDMINNTVFWSKQVYDIHEKPYSYTPTLAEGLDFYDTESKPIIQAAVERTISRGEPFDERLRIVSALGYKKYIRTKGEAVYRNGQLVKVVGIFQDITKEREAETKLIEYAESLEKKNNELDQFAYIVSHDLKAPLRGIHNLSLWIEEDLDPTASDELKQHLLLLRKRVVRMENLINGILEYSRVSRTKSELEYFSTYELIMDIVSMLNIQSSTAVNIIQPLPFLRSERIKLEQIFSNLIGNSLKYNTSSSPELKIWSEETAKQYSFFVSDNGPGIDPKYHEKIFTIFQTLHNSDSIENTGVGLAIVKKIVEDEGGKVSLLSDLGKGATFIFTWPK